MHVQRKKTILWGEWQLSTVEGKGNKLYSHKRYPIKKTVCIYNQSSWLSFPQTLPVLYLVNKYSPKSPGSLTWFIQQNHTVNHGLYYNGFPRTVWKSCIWVRTEVQRECQVLWNHSFDYPRVGEKSARMKRTGKSNGRQRLPDILSITIIGFSTW